MKITLEKGDDITLGIEPIEKNRVIEVWRGMAEGEEQAGVFVDGNTVWSGDLTKAEDAPRSNAVKQKVELWDTVGSFIIIEAPTSIVYSNQCGGTACAHPEAEGWLIPLHRWSWADGTEDIVSSITRDLWGEGVLAGLDKKELERLDAAIKRLEVVGMDSRPDKIKLDTFRLDKTRNGEAWVPVLTPWGKGWLTWENSD